MSATIRAAAANSVKTKLVMQPGGTIAFNRDGSVTARETYHVAFNIALSKAPKRYETGHPNYPALICDDVKVQRLPGDMAEVSVDYVGDPSAYYGGYASKPTPLYTLIVEAGEEPIETFYNSDTVNFNTIATAANGAVLGANGLFAGWRKDSQFVGITAYLKPRIVWRMESFFADMPTGFDVVGKIDEPQGEPPTFTGDRDWLLRSYTYQFQGAIYRFQKEWLLSNPGGWNPTIYT